ncbi:MAG: flavin reductase family protein [Clostridia bacterium]|nr:flavin reductase family protein [Clostridia bacterium]
MLRPVEISKFTNAVERIGKDWMLITAAADGKVNTMTASWGCVGELWNKPVAICFIRPQRYTYEFTEKSDKLSLSFFGKDMRGALALCGRESGRDTDKFAATGLNVAYCDDTPYIAEAHDVLICRKLYADDLREDSFIDRKLLEHYPIKDYHRVYVCEIEKVLSDAE